MSSGTTHKMRQPGRLVAPYDPNNCQVCDPNKGIPNNTLGLVLEGMPFGCCSIDISSTQANPHILTAITDPCLTDLFGNKLACTWTLTLTLGGLYVEFTVTLSCVGGTTPTIAIGVNQVDSSGALIAAVASGSATLSGACGAVDCSQLNGISGTLTLYDGSICQPSAGHCTSPTWAVLFGTQNCPANHANECCCGGPSDPCYYLCIEDDACGGAMEVVVCRKSDGSYTGDGGAISSASMSYDPSAGYQISWHCGTTNNSITIPPGSAGWTSAGGKIQLSGSGPGFTVKAGASPQCGHTSSSCGPCAANTFPSMIFAELSGGALTNNTCSRCGDISGVWALEDSQYTASPLGCNCSTPCSHYFYDPHFQVNSGNCLNDDGSACGDWILGMCAVACILDGSTWKWTFGWFLQIVGDSQNSTLCARCTAVSATYSGPVMSIGASCDLSTPVELLLDAPWGAGDATMGCFGPPPASVLLFT